MKHVFLFAGMIGVMLGLLGVIIVVWDPDMGGAAAFAWLMGIFAILIGYAMEHALEAKPMQIQQFPPAPAGMTAFCPHCGSQVAVGAVKCPRCGRSL